MKTYLKIKIKSLAEEARIIKFEEAKWKQVPWLVDNHNLHHPIFWGLKQHRLEEVRKECRYANIAYGYLRGRSYHQIEHKCYEAPNWERVAELVRKYSTKVLYHSPEARKMLLEHLKAWANGADQAVAA